MALVVALVSIEGSINRAPNTVFELDGDSLKHLEEAAAVRPATKEDVAIAKTNGLFIESEDTAEADRAAAEKAAADKAAADKAAAEKAEADRAAAEKAKATKATKAAEKAAAKADEEL